MKNDIYLIGEVGYDITLQSVIDLIKKSDPKKPLNLHIHSAGGSVYDGIAIYNYLKRLDQEINTFSAGLVASIATLFFLTGKKETRTIHSGDKFLIHLPTNGMFGNADEFEKGAEELRTIENQLAEIYNKETGISIEDALLAMKNEKFSSEDWLTNNGFVANVIEFKAVAKLTKTKINIKNKKMPKTNLSKKDKNFFTNIFNKYLGSPKNKMILDAEGVELDFAELEEDAVPKVGDVATVDGENANGSFVIPTDDDATNGQTYDFTDGELMTITLPEGDDDSEEVADLKEQIATLTAENKKGKDDLKEIKDDFKKMKNKIESSFEFNGTKLRNGEDGKGKETRNFVPKNKQ